MRDIQWLLWAWGQYADRLVMAELDYYGDITRYDDSYRVTGERLYP